MDCILQSQPTNIKRNIHLIQMQKENFHENREGLKNEKIKWNFPGKGGLAGVIFHFLFSMLQMA